MHFRGTLYRALNPVWARTPLSGEGARRYGGRFNRRGVAAIYTSLSIQAAIREANQVGDFQPLTLVAYRADLDPVFDATDAAAMASRGWAADDLAAGDWRLQMRARGSAGTQDMAARLAADGHVGMRVRSFAPGASAGGLNLVLWRWGDHPPAQLTLIDDEGRLNQPPV